MCLGDVVVGVRPMLCVVVIVGLGSAVRPGAGSAARVMPCVSARSWCVCVCVSVCVSLGWCVGGWRGCASLGQRACVCVSCCDCVSARFAGCRGKVRASPGLLPENSGAAF